MWLYWCIYTLSEIITVPNIGAKAKPNNEKNIIIKNCPLFTNIISEINNTQIDNTKDIYKVMTMYDLVSDNSSKTSESLWQYYRDEPFLDNNGAIADFPEGNNNSALFKFKAKMTDRTENDGTKNVKIRVPLKYLSNFYEFLQCHKLIVKLILL